MKKSISVLLIILFVLTIIPVRAFAADSSTAYDAICEGLENVRKSINLSEYNLSETEFKNLFLDILYNTPSFFYVKKVYGYSVSGNKVVSLVPKYIMEPQKIKNAVNDYNQKLDKIVSLLPIGLNDTEKALFFHDYICLNFEYDESLQVHDSYTLMTTGKGVCEAYAQLYDALLEKVNIESRAVISESMGHMWNAVKLGDKYYHVDITWDDPIPDRKGYVGHEYFLQSDRGIKSKGHDSYSCSQACNDSRFDCADWKNCSSAFGYADNSVFFTDGRDIKKISLSDGKSETVFTITDIWKVWDSTAYYNESFSGFGSCDGYLLFNTPSSVYTFDPVTEECTEIFRYTGNDGYIYGFYNIGSNGYCRIATDADDIENVSYKSFAINTGGNTKPKAGDINGDGVFDGADIVLACQIDAGSLVMTPEMSMAFDVDGNGICDGADLVLMVQADAGVLSDFPKC